MFLFSRVLFLRWHAAAPSFSCKLLYKHSFAHIVYTENLSIAMRGSLKIVQLPHFKHWKLRLKFIVGLTFVHSF